MSDSTARLHAAVAAACPITGVSVGTPGLASSVGFVPTAAATTAQLAAAQAAITAFDWSAAAETAWELTLQPNKQTVVNQQTQAITDIDTYLAVVAPTAVQQTAQVKRLSQIVRALVNRAAEA